MASLDLELVRHALDVARQHGFAEVELEYKGGSFSAKLDAKQKPKASSKAQSDTESEPLVSNLQPVPAPLVGYYKQAAEPMSIGQHVKKGDVIAVITALGLANDIESPISGEIVEVLVKDGDPIEFGQSLAKVRTT